MLNVRFDNASASRPHCNLAFYINGACTGNLTLLNAEALLIQRILYEGCNALGFKYKSTGQVPRVDAAQLQRCVALLKK